MKTQFSKCVAAQKFFVCLAIVMGLAVCAPLAQNTYAAEKNNQTVFRQAMKAASKEDKEKIKQIRAETKAQVEKIRDDSRAKIAQILGISMDDMPKKEKDQATE